MTKPITTMTSTIWPPTFWLEHVEKKAELASGFAILITVVGLQKSSFKNQLYSYKNRMIVKLCSISVC